MKKVLDFNIPDSLIESLAAIEHERWSHWQKYLHEQCRKNEDGSLTIPADLVSRWTIQASTDYSELSEKEKNSDREQVLLYIPVLIGFLKNG
ncbi:hypothetical protein PSAR109036_12980 [Psychrobacter arenosus]|uniref:hypothetical protein n=1 Tax=Psychrobacter arenosus TaxID=256326 RepID=UPI00191A3CA0|nr:hypothetical protein [Psychrobacter arenosus]